jgi:hypothetical protein
MGYSEQIDIARYAELPGHSSLTLEPIAQSRCNRLDISRQQTPRSYKIAGTPLSNTIGHIQAHELKIFVGTICREGYGATTSSDIHQVLRDKYGERGIRSSDSLFSPVYRQTAERCRAGKTNRRSVSSLARHKPF